MLNLLKPPLPSPPPPLLPTDLSKSPPPPPLPPLPAFQISPDLSPVSPPCPLAPKSQALPDLPRSFFQISPTSFARTDNLAIYKAFLSSSKLEGLAGMPPGRDWGAPPSRTRVLRSLSHSPPMDQKLAKTPGFCFSAPFKP